MDAIDLPAPTTKAAAQRRHGWLWILAAFWLGGVVFGLSVLWRYENRPGPAANAPAAWPAASTLVRATDRATLVLVAHPQCPCTRASLENLAEVIARAPKPPKTYILFLRPSAFDPGWVQTDLWRTASALPNAIVLRDDDGAEAQRFGVETSGDTLLYTSAGALAFSGGITDSRGHAGESAGESALVALLTSGKADRHAANVFGCPLFATSDAIRPRDSL